MTTKNHDSFQKWQVYVTLVQTPLAKASNMGNPDVHRAKKYNTLTGRGSKYLRSIWVTENLKMKALTEAGQSRLN